MADTYTLLFDIQTKGMPQLAQQTGRTTQATQKFDTAQKNLNATTNTTNSNLSKTKGGMEAVEKSSASAGTKIRNFGAGMTTAAFGISTLATGVVGLQRSYRDLSDAQGRVDKTNLKLSKANEALTKAQEKLKEVTKKNGKGSKEYEAALLDVKQAQDQVGVATFNASEAQENFNDTQENFKLQLLPTFLGFGTTAAGIFSAFSGGANGAAKATTTMGRGMKALNTVLKLSPLFILVGVILAIRNNTFGFRDALEALGKKLGDMFPGLKGFLTWVHDLGEALGLTGGKLDLSKAFDLLKSGFKGAIDTLQKTDWGAVLQSIITAIETWVNNTDWNTVWSQFQSAMYATGTWIYEKLGLIGDAIIKYFSNPDVQKMLWEGFQYAMWATGTWIFEQLGKIGDAIIKYFSNPDVQKSMWEGFQYAMWATGSWLFEQLGKIGDALIKYFGDPNVQKAIWEGFQNAMYSTGKWLYDQLGKILQFVYTYFSNPKNTDAMWNGFREALYAAGKWVGEMLLKVMAYIQNWWGSNKGTLTKAFNAFWNWIYDSAVTLGKNLPQKILDGINKSADILKKIGEKIWGGIKGGINGLIDSANKLLPAGLKIPKLAQGGLIQSAAAGKIFTTRGPTLTLAGDNPGGKETVAYIPHNNPLPTLKSIMKVFGGKIGGGGSVTAGNSFGNGTAVFHFYIQVGGKTIEEIVQQVEIGLGKNFRTIIA